MRTYLHITGLVRAVNEPDMGETKKGDDYFRMKVAGDNPMGKEDSATFLPLVCFSEPVVERMGEKIEKGSLLFVDGFLSQDNFEDKDGNKRTGYTIIASDVRFMGVTGKSEKKDDDDDEDDKSKKKDKKKDKKDKKKDKKEDKKKDKKKSKKDEDEDEDDEDEKDRDDEDEDDEDDDKPIW